MRYVVLGLIHIGLAVYCLVDIAQTEERNPRGIAKGLWAAMVLLLPLLGGIAWLVLKWRERGDGDRTQGQRPPDDDPEYLGWLEQRQRRRRGEA